jgi:hypothetical protein
MLHLLLTSNVTPRTLLSICVSLNQTRRVIISWYEYALNCQTTCRLVSSKENIGLPSSLRASADRKKNLHSALRESVVAYFNSRVINSLTTCTVELSCERFLPSLHSTLYTVALWSGRGHVHRHPLKSTNIPSAFDFPLRWLLHFACHLYIQGMINKRPTLARSVLTLKGTHCG